MNVRRTCISLLFGSMLFSFFGCRSRTKVPEPGSGSYKEATSAFYAGLAALQVGHDVHAEQKLSEFTRLVPADAAGWANWGMLALRQRNYDMAAERLQKARELAPQNQDVLYLLGLLESERGHTQEAIGHLRKVMEINPRNLRAIYRLAENVERQGGAGSDAEFEMLVQKILALRPDNLAALLELGRVAAKRGDTDTLKSVTAKIESRASAWPSAVQKQIAALQRATETNDLRAAATQIVFVRNVLMQVPEFRRSLAQINAPPGEEAEPLLQPLALASPSSKPAMVDAALNFKPERPAQVPNGNWDWIATLSFGGAEAPTIAVADGKQFRLPTEVSLPFPSGRSTGPRSPEAVVQADLNYDFRNDVILIGATGVRIFRQDSPNVFTDVTQKTKLPIAALRASYTGGWPVDIEADGDLDIVLGATSGNPVVFRNNGDDTVTQVHPFEGISGLQQFVWADLDGDGDPDASLLDGARKLHVFENQRIGQFRPRTLPHDLQQVQAITAADVNKDHVLDLLVVQEDGRIIRLSDKDDGEGWVTAEIARTSKRSGDDLIRLRVADLDNNGAVDLLLCVLGRRKTTDGKSAIWLQDETGRFIPMENGFSPASVFDVVDLNNDGRLDLLGLAADGEPLQAINHGSKKYHWQVIRTRAVQATGDQRVNPFGIGGEIEVRAGLLAQKAPITGPQVHFGLGEQASADVVRVIWPNGSVSAEFDLKVDQQILTEQRIKGSCPYMFAFNGKEMKFVKDTVPWGSAIGLRINTLGTARVEATTEWFKIGRDELVPRDGFYDIRITAELWETYYYDQLALMTVDHPAGTEIYVDERFVVPPVKLAIIATDAPRKVVRAIDDNGQDVTPLVRDLDDKYVDTFGRGQYQGITRDHYLEIDLGEDVPTDAPLWLIAKGWMHPTDSSINVALSQGNKYRAQGLTIEVPDGRGGWVVAKSNLGFPAGRKKISLFDISGIFRRGTPRHLRLRTNLEIYWDSIEWAKGRPDMKLHVAQSQPALADLHFRGFSAMHQADPSSPELPDYNRLEGSKQRWRDLAGYYTRYGDVRELLSKVDDRYVIMNSGDEMTFRFPAQTSPAAGWVRDFVIIGDGWIKDGDYNSTFSKTVLPLPYHNKNVYDTTPGRLEDEWVYRRYPKDWEIYHTRYVTPDAFKNSLRSEVH